MSKRIHRADDHELTLLRAIAESPDDDGLVAVYGDYLTERGDPRGEFIALSLAEAHGKRVKGKLEKFSKEHRAALAGPLHEICRVNYRRGVCDEVSGVVGDFVSARKRREAALDPRWATVRRLGLSQIEDESVTPLILTQAPLYALEQVRLFASWLRLAGERAFPWQLKAVQLYEAHDAVTSIRAEAFPRLRKLEVLHVPVMVPRAVWNSPLFAQLHELKLNLIGPQLLGETVRRCAELVGLQSFDVLIFRDEIAAAANVPALEIRGEHAGKALQLRLEVGGQEQMLRQFDVQAIKKDLSTVARTKVVKSR